MAIEHGKLLGCRVYIGWLLLNLHNLHKNKIWSHVHFYYNLVHKQNCWNAQECNMQKFLWYDTNLIVYALSLLGVDKFSWCTTSFFSNNPFHLSFWLSGNKAAHLFVTTVTSQNHNCCIPKPEPFRLLTVMDRHIYGHLYL